MIDLHCHTTASDGVTLPEELPRLAESMGLSAVAITDHDTVEGVEAFLSSPCISLVPGLELSSVCEKDKCHIVGLFIDHRSEELLETLQQLQVWRRERNQMMAHRLTEIGIPVDIEEVEALAEGVAGRPHFAEVLVARGVCGNLNEAFKKYLGDGAAAYVPKKSLEAADAIRAIHRAGGLAVWAHPMARSNMTNARFSRMLDALFHAGIDGVEAYYPDHTATKKLTVLREVEMRGLLASGGSDYHGGGRHTGIMPGTFANGGPLGIPDDVLYKMEDRLGRGG